MELILIAIAAILAFVAFCETFFAKQDKPMLALECKNIWLQRVCRLCLPLCALLLLVAFIMAPLNSFWDNVALYAFLSVFGLGWLLLMEMFFRTIKKILTIFRPSQFKTAFTKFFNWFWL